MNNIILNKYLVEYLGSRVAKVIQRQIRDTTTLMKDKNNNINMNK